MPRASRRRAAIGALLGGCFLWALLAAGPSSGATRATQETFQRRIIDKRSKLHPKFDKTRRLETRYIVVHTSECGLQNTLNVVLNGKHQGGRRLSYGGHAHYVIARDGRTFRTLDKEYRADHAGTSMWNGEEDISNVSIGIELVGYHHTAITSKQYRAVGILIDILQEIYVLNDAAALTHSQVAYGTPNRWVQRPARGRKRCAKNFERQRAGLGPTWEADPDVTAGRLQADRELARIYYGSGRGRAVPGTSIVTASNTAWMIAGEDYNTPETLYRLPGGRVLAGDQLERALGWGRIPAGTEILLNAAGPATTQGPVVTLTDGQTAWTVAGTAYDKDTTLYIFPGGRVKHGGQISDWDGLPARTRIVVGYRGPFLVTQSRPPTLIAGQRYRDARTLYIFPNSTIVSGAQIQDFRRLPRGVRMVLPVAAV